MSAELTKSGFMPSKSDRLEILLVEDQTDMAEYFVSIIKKVIERFPGCTVTYVRFLAEALTIIRSHAPDVVLLDLTLADRGNTMEETLTHVEAIQEKCPLLILTGHDVDRVKALIPLINVEIVNKRDAYSRPRWFFNLILNVVTIWRAKRKREDDESMANLIFRMREIAEELHEPHRTN